MMSFTINVWIAYFDNITDKDLERMHLCLPIFYELNANKIINCEFWKNLLVAETRQGKVLETSRAECLEGSADYCFAARFG